MSESTDELVRAALIINRNLAAIHVPKGKALEKIAQRMIESRTALAGGLRRRAGPHRQRDPRCAHARHRPYCRVKDAASITVKLVALFMHRYRRNDRFRRQANLGRNDSHWGAKLPSRVPMNQRQVTSAVGLFPDCQDCPTMPTSD